MNYNNNRIYRTLNKISITQTQKWLIKLYGYENIGII